MSPRSRLFIPGPAESLPPDANGAGLRGPNYVAEHVSKSFSGVSVLSDVSIELVPGEIHALVGENGAGKSTLLKIMAGIYSLDAGKLVLGGQPQPALTPREAQSRGIYLVPQEPRLMPDLSIAENLFLGALPRRRMRFAVDWKQMMSSARTLLTTASLDLDPRALAGTLSLAQQQMLECARALAHGCHVVFFDEPTSPLTGHETERLFTLMRQLRARGFTLAFISHRFEEVEELTDRVTVLRDGAAVLRARTAEVSRQEMVDAMVGRALTLTKRRAAADRTGEVRLEVKDLASAPEVRNISVQARSGEVIGLAGLVGSGRTEFAESVFGIRPLDGGRVLLDGRDITGYSPRRCIDAGLVYLAEDRGRNGVFAEVDITRNVTSAITARIPRRLRYFLKLGDEGRLARDLAQDMQVRAANMGSPIKTLSGGNQQKALFARWIAAGPRVAIFDEPTRGVDVGAKEGIYKIIEQLADDGLAALVISSELEELVRLCDRVYAVYEGQVVGELAGEDITMDAMGVLVVGGGR